MSKTILFVDDEIKIINMLKRLFFDTDYKLLSAHNGKEALEKMESHHIDMLVTDIRMPEMDGYRLLRIVKNYHPDIIRIAMSGYSDDENVYRALCENLASFYFHKPWNEDVFINTINSIFKLEVKLKNTHMMEFIKNIDSLPSLPTIYMNISRLIEKDANIEEIVKEIEKDPAIASKTLHIANSAHYNLNTASIHKATTFLGLNLIKNISLASKVMEQVENNELKFDLWQLSNLISQIINLIYEKFLKQKAPDKVLLAGLLCNIGHVVLLVQNKESNKNIYRTFQEQNINIVEFERKNLGFSHQELGGYLLKWWGLPVEIVEAALFHHEPMTPGIINNEIVNLVHIANHFAIKRIFTHSFGDGVVKKSLESFDISYDKLAKEVSKLPI